MSVNVVIDRYATALFELAKEKGLLEAVENDLLYVQSVLEEPNELSTLLVYPSLEADKKCDVLEKLFTEAIQPIALYFLCVMVKRGRARYIEGTIKEYCRRSKEARGIYQAKVIVAQPLSDALQDKLRQKLQTITGKTYEFIVRVDPKIIGGIVIQAGDTRIDASLARRLDDLKDYLFNTGLSEIGVKN